jgi:4-amino-4-deoxy-L-arabinose transferase-like glycosyltransferase
MLSLEHFTNSQIIHFYTSIFIIIASLVIFQKGKTNIALLLLFAGVFLLGMFMGLLDPYLHYWDEQYHALVAKNMMENPFKPVLIKNPVLPYNHEIWIGNHVWLHKQPLFLWMISLSLKIFGVTAWAVRFPSILMHSLMIFLIFRIGKIVYSKKLGFYAAFIFSFSYYLIELTIGAQVCDHNDTAFVFFATASFWAWFEYQNSNNKYWLFLIGLFSGCAILVKWLVGLLVYLGWGLSLVADKERFNLKKYIPLLLSLFVTVLIVLPWQIYIIQAFPVESAYEYSYNTRHFFEVIEEHGGDWKFHFQHLKTLYGDYVLTPWLLLSGFILLIARIKEQKYKIVLATSVISIYIFYSLAASKMISFGLVVSFIAFLSLAMLVAQIELIISKYRNGKLISLALSTILVLILSYLSFDTETLNRKHTLKEPHNNAMRVIKTQELSLIKALPQLVPDTSYVIFNTPFYAHIQIMFFTDYKSAYDFIPNEHQCRELLKQNISFVVLDNGQAEIPEYLNELNIKVIKNPFWN